MSLLIVVRPPRFDVFDSSLSDKISTPLRLCRTGGNGCSAVHQVASSLRLMSPAICPLSPVGLPCSIERRLTEVRCTSRDCLGGARGGGPGCETGGMGGIGACCSGWVGGGGGGRSIDFLGGEAEYMSSELSSLVNSASLGGIGGAATGMAPGTGGGDLLASL